MNRLKFPKALLRHHTVKSTWQLISCQNTAFSHTTDNNILQCKHQSFKPDYYKIHLWYNKRLYASGLKKEDLDISNSLKREDFLQSVLHKRKEQFIEKRDGFVKDIKDKKSRVKERMEEIIERENIITIPNLLCVGRAILAPYLGYTIVHEQFTLALGLLAAAGLSDLLDGWIARTWAGQASKMGSFLDPMADKLLVGTLFISLTCCHLLPLWLTAMVLIRDVALVAAGFVIRYKSLPEPRTLSRYFDVTHATAQLAPTFISKLNTVVQLGMVAGALGAPLGGYIDHPALQACCVLTGLTTVAAACSYILQRNTYHMLKQQCNK